jgi:hypothetical protein
MILTSGHSAANRDKPERYRSVSRRYCSSHRKCKPIFRTPSAYLNVTGRPEWRCHWASLGAIGRYRSCYRPPGVALNSTMSRPSPRAVAVRPPVPFASRAHVLPRSRTADGEMPGDHAAVVAGKRGAFDAGSDGHDSVRRTKFLRIARHCRTQGQSKCQQGQSSNTTNVHR